MTFDIWAEDHRLSVNHTPMEIDDFKCCWNDAQAALLTQQARNKVPLPPPDDGMKA